MAYSKVTVEDGVTVIDKALLDHIQDGIVALDAQTRALADELSGLSAQLDDLNGEVVE